LLSAAIVEEVELVWVCSESVECNKLNDMQLQPPPPPPKKKIAILGHK
jgi:hypothetical protein